MSTQSPNPNIVTLQSGEEFVVGESLTTKALRRLRNDRLSLIAIGYFVIISVLCFSAPLFEQILGVSFSKTNVTQSFLPVCIPALGIGTDYVRPQSLRGGNTDELPVGCDPKHILGTDDLGRDHLVRLLYGGQVSLRIAFLAAAISLAIGVTLGMITGFFGGVVDDAVNFVITVLSSVPNLFLLLIISAFVLQNEDLLKIFPSDILLVIVLGILGWTGTTRLVRGETLSIREREYIVGARAMGARPLRIMFVHILPNLLSIVVITLAADIGGLILAEAALSFLGLGVRVPLPSWGNMLSQAQTFFTYGVHLVILPGVLIFTTVLCLYILGDGIRDAFDPTARD